MAIRITSVEACCADVQQPTNVPARPSNSTSVATSCLDQAIQHVEVIHADQW
jgi:hypothetical protein